MIPVLRLCHVHTECTWVTSVRDTQTSVRDTQTSVRDTQTSVRDTQTSVREGLPRARMAVVLRNESKNIQWLY